MKYYKHDFKLSEEQLQNIVKAINTKEPITLTLTCETFKDGNTPLPVTKTEALNVIDNKGFNYNLTKTKMKMLKLPKEGGIFPLLIPILAGITALTSGIGAATGIAKTVIDKQSNEAKLEEEKRHNQAMEEVAKGSGMYLTSEIPKEGGFITTYPAKLSCNVVDFINRSKLDPIAKKTLKNILKNLSDKFNIEKQGDGLYLSPR